MNLNAVMLVTILIILFLEILQYNNKINKYILPMFRLIVLIFSYFMCKMFKLGVFINVLFIFVLSSNIISLGVLIKKNR